MIDAKYVAGTPEVARFDYSRVNTTAVDKTAHRINLAAAWLWRPFLEGPGGPNNQGPVWRTFFRGDYALLTKNERLDFVSEHWEHVLDNLAKREMEAIRLAEAAATAAAAIADDLGNN